MKNIKLYQTVSEFENSEKVYPHLSYVEEAEKIYCYASEPQNCVYLPCIDTSSYPINLCLNEKYPQIRQILDEIDTMYSDEKGFVAWNLSRIDYDKNTWVLQLTYSDYSIVHYDVSNEPLILNYFNSVIFNDYRAFDTINCRTSFSKYTINETLVEENWNTENWEYYTFEEDGTLTYNNIWT